MNNSAPREPAAVFRQAAATYRQLYLALVDEGFTQVQAMTIIGHAISAGAQGGNK